MLLGGIYKSLQSEQVPSSSWAPSKVRLGLLDLQREADLQNIPLKKPKSHPQRSVNAQRLFCAVEEDKIPALTHDLYKAYWQKEKISQIQISSEHMDRNMVFLGMYGQMKISNNCLHIQNEPFKKVLLVFLLSNSMINIGGGRIDCICGCPPQNPSGIDSETLSEYWPDGGMLQNKDIYFITILRVLFPTWVTHKFKTSNKNIKQTFLYTNQFVGSALFRNIGTPNVPIFAMNKTKQQYMMRDLQDWAKWWGLQFSFPKTFPMRTVLHYVLHWSSLNHTVLYQAYWVDGRDIGMLKIGMYFT